MSSKSFLDQKLGLISITLFWLAVIMAVQTAQAGSDKHRLSWTDNTATTMTIGFRPVSGTDHHVTAGKSANGADWRRYEVTATRSWSGLTNQFVKLTGLDPDEAYHYKVCDSEELLVEDVVQNGP